MYCIYEREYIIGPSFLYPQLRINCVFPPATAVNRMKLNDYQVNRPGTHAGIHQAYFEMNLFMACFMAKETSGHQCRSTGRTWTHQHLVPCFNESCVQGPHYQWSSLLSTLWLDWHPICCIYYNLSPMWPWIGNKNNCNSLPLVTH